MIRTLGCVTALLFVVGGCTTAGAPSGSPAGGASTGASAASGTPVAATTAAPTQTQVEWGRIWDALPPSFPRYPGAEPTQIGAGPASAVLTVPADARTAAAWYAMALKAAGYPTVGANGHARGRQLRRRFSRGQRPAAWPRRRSPHWAPRRRQRSTWRRPAPSAERLRDLSRTGARGARCRRFDRGRRGRASGSRRP